MIGGWQSGAWLKGKLTHVLLLFQLPGYFILEGEWKSARGKEALVGDFLGAIDMLCHSAMCV
jgi:hypothetical protein